MKTSSLSLALGGTLLAGWLLTGPALAQTQRPSIPLGGEYKRYPPLAAVLRSGDDPSSVSTGANTVICTSARDGRCDERS